MSTVVLLKAVKSVNDVLCLTDSILRVDTEHTAAFRSMMFFSNSNKENNEYRSTYKYICSLYVIKIDF